MKQDHDSKQLKVEASFESIASQPIQLDGTIVGDVDVSLPCRCKILQRKFLVVLHLSLIFRLITNTNGKKVKPLGSLEVLTLVYLHEEIRKLVRARNHS